MRKHVPPCALHPVVTARGKDNAVKKIHRHHCLIDQAWSMAQTSRRRLPVARSSNSSRMSLRLYVRRGAAAPRCISDVQSSGVVHYTDVVDCVYKSLQKDKHAVLDNDALQGVFLLFEDQEIPVMSSDQLEIVLKLIAVAMSNNFLHNHSVRVGRI